MAKKTLDGMEIIKRRFGINPRTDANVQAFSEDFRVAQLVYDARQAAGMTQKELADAIGSTESVVAELEDADYDGDSLSMLRWVPLLGLPSSAFVHYPWKRKGDRRAY